MLGGRHGFSLAKSLKPTPRLEQNVSGIVQDGVHFRMARHAIDLPFVEIDQRSCLAQQLLGRIQIVEEFDRKRIEREMRSRPVRGRPVVAVRRSHRRPPALCPCRAVRSVSIARSAGFRSDDRDMRQIRTPCQGNRAGRAGSGKQQRPVSGPLLDLDRYVPALITFIANKLSRSATVFYQKRFRRQRHGMADLSLLAIEPAFLPRGSATSSASTRARSAATWR